MRPGRPRTAQICYIGASQPFHHVTSIPHDHMAPVVSYAVVQGSVGVVQWNSFARPGQAFVVLYGIAATQLTGSELCRRRAQIASLRQAAPHLC